MARPLSAQARERALDAAHALLYERGLDGFTVDAVAQRSRVAKSTIYRHFASAHELLAAALDVMVAPVPTPNTGSLRADLYELFLTRLPVVNDPALRRIVLGMLAARADDPDLAGAVEALKEQRTAPIRTVVQLAVGRGDIPADTNVDLAVDLLEGPLFVHVFVRDLPVDETCVRALVDLAVAGLEAPRRP